MAQHDYVIANASGATVRADINNMALAISSNNSGSSAPGTTYAYLWWLDTSANVLKLRNSANNAWITMPFSVTANNTVDINGGTIDGTNIGASSAGTGAFTTLSASGALTGTLGTAAQPNITSLGNLTSLTGGTGDLVWDTTTLVVDSSANNVGIGVSPIAKLHINLGTDKNILFAGNIGEIGSVAGFQVANDSGSALGSFGIRATDIRFATGSSEAMRIDSLGKVGIGTDSPDNTLHVDASGGGTIKITRESASTANFLRLECDGTNGTIVSKQATIFNNGDAERMRIDSSGRVKAQCLSGVGGFYLTEGTADAFSINSEGANGNLLFKDIYNSSERMRILANGNVGINTTNPGDKLSVCGTVRFNTTPGDGEEARHYFTVGGAADAASYTMYDGGQNAKVFFTGNGGSYFTGGNLGVGDDSPAYRLELPNTASTAGQVRANAYQTYSDSRIKTNIQTLSYGLDIVKQLKPSQYKHHNSIKEDGQFVKQDEGANDIGFIAQEVLPLIPEVVSVPVDTDKDLYSISYPKLTAVLTKAIQEQQTIIEDLKTRIETLEG